jgi:hypothetical protein
MTSDFLTFPDDPPRARRYTRCIDRMCGATDCPACHPSHFTGGIYIGDAHEIAAERDTLRARAEAAEALVGTLQNALTEMLHLCEHDLGMDEGSPYIELANATEAFLKTLNLWVPSK